MGMGGGVNTTMKDKHLNLEDATCQHNGQPPARNKGRSSAKGAFTYRSRGPYGV